MTFTVQGYGKNPVPYKRTTTKQKRFDPDYKVYQEWKNNVIGAFAKSFGKFPHSLLEKNTKYYVDVMAFYKDKTHGDTDNIAKGVNDALFQKPLNDKYVAGSYDYDYDKENPRVEVTISKSKRSLS